MGVTQKEFHELKTFLTQSTTLTCRIHPLVTTIIVDAYARRPQDEKRAIGTLMGYMSEGNVIEVVDCFPVVHSDTEDRGVLMDQDYHRRMVALRQSVHPQEQVLGWFSCGDNTGIAEDTVSVHNFYREAKESLFNTSGGLQNPIHLQIDTSCRNQKLSIKVYTNLSNSSTNIIQFHQVPLDKTSFEQDKDIMDMLLHARFIEETTGTAPQLAKLDAFSKNLDELLQLFEQAKEYTHRVVQGRTEGNPEVGRALTRVLASEALLDEDKFQTLCNGAMKDTLMVMYLSHLTRTQIVLAENISQILHTSSSDN